MKWIGFLVGLLWATVALAEQTPRGAQGLVCDNSAIYDASTSGATQLVALQSGKTIFICGFSFNVGGTATNVKLISGTGTNCGTGTQDLTPAFQIGINGNIVDPSPFGNSIFTGASRALCINASAGNAVQALVRYTIK